MRITSATLAAGLVLLSMASVVSASSDYPPAGAVVVVAGELIVGEEVDVTVHNCRIGEDVRTELEGMSAVMSTCQSPVAPFAEPASSPSRRPGMSQYRLHLPLEVGVVAGTVELFDSGETLSFFLDVRARAAQPAAQTTPQITVATARLTPSQSSLPGWPFLVLAGAIILVVVAVVARDRRHAETTP